MKKYYQFNFCNEFYIVYIEKRTYKNNKRLAVRLTEQTEEPFAIITTNIDYPLSENDDDLAFIDTNNIPGIEEWLIKNKIAEPTGHIGYSGYCSYPEYRFNNEVFEK